MYTLGWDLPMEHGTKCSSCIGNFVQKAQQRTGESLVKCQNVTHL